MKKTWLVIPLGVILFLVIWVFIGPEKVSDISNLSPSPTPTMITTPTPVDFTAGFEIYTLGTKRIFTDSKYHNLSNDVYLTLSDPNQITIKKSGVSWADFFMTLPMELTKDCLTTGTKQTFCTNEKNSLKFFINDKEDKNALDKLIEPDDKLNVVYE